MTRAISLLGAVSLWCASGCKPPSLVALPPPPPKLVPLGAIGGEFTAGPGRFVIGVEETTDPARVRGALQDLFGGDPGHVCFRGDPLRVTSLAADAFPRVPGKSESYFESGRLMVRLPNPLDPKHPMTTFEVWPCAELSIGGARVHDAAKVRDALFAPWTGGAGPACFHGTEIEARSLVETVLREHKHFDKAEVKVGELTVWLTNPATPADKTPRAFKYAKCAR